MMKFNHFILHDRLEVIYIIHVHTLILNHIQWIYLCYKLVFQNNKILYKKNVFLIRISHNSLKIFLKKCAEFYIHYKKIIFNKYYMFRPQVVGQHRYDQSPHSRYCPLWRLVLRHSFVLKRRLEGRREYINCHWPRFLSDVWLYWHTGTSPSRGQRGVDPLVEGQRSLSDPTVGANCTCMDIGGWVMLIHVDTRCLFHSWLSYSSSILSSSRASVGRWDTCDCTPTLSQRW